MCLLVTLLQTKREASPDSMFYWQVFRASLSAQSENGRDLNIQLREICSTT
jgi:hypothetical protein